MSVWDIIIKYHEGLLNGLLVTLELALIVWSAGIVIGGLLGIAGTKWPLQIGLPSLIGSFVLSGIPVLVFLFWLHYPLQAMLGIVINPFITAAVTLSVINIFGVADLVRRVLREFPSQYVLAARACGLSSHETLTHIQLPITLHQVLPSLLVLQITMLQTTLFASLISVDELFRVAQRINAIEYRPVEIYTALGLFFLAICLPANGLALWLRGKYTRNLSEH